jgi:hypothetical protein
LATAERIYQAPAREANARVTLAEGKRKRAQECIAKAMSTMEGFEVPLAAWWVYATATELYTLAGNEESANRRGELSRATILKSPNLCQQKTRSKRRSCRPRPRILAGS